MAVKGFSELRESRIVPLEGGYDLRRTLKVFPSGAKTYLSNLGPASVRAEIGIYTARMAPKVANKDAVNFHVPVERSGLNCGFNRICCVGREGFHIVIAVAAEVRPKPRCVIL